MIDCGANLGSFSRYAIENKASMVYAYEPSRGIWPYLLRSIEEFPQIKVFPYAVDNSNSQQEFIECYHPCGSHFNFTDKQINEYCLYKDKYSVPTVTLDSMHTKVDFLKIDVEGAALRVIQGGINLIKTNKPKIAIACYHYPGEKVLLIAALRAINASYQFEERNGVLFAW